MLPFAKVIFTELGRAEAQRLLDVMKQEQKSPSNMSAKTNFSPYSREGSVHSFSSTASMSREAVPGFSKSFLLLRTMIIQSDSMILLYVKY